MNTQNIALKEKKTDIIDELSGNYLNGEFEGATGASPDPYLWNNLNYRSGWLTGVAEYFDKKYAGTLVKQEV